LSEETELRAALAASITDTHFKPVCYDLSDSDDDNDTDDISETPDDEEPNVDSSNDGTGNGAVVPDSDNCTKTTSDDSKSKIETVTTSRDSSVDSGDNCVSSLHDDDAVVESPVLSRADSLVPTEDEKPRCWKDFFGPESGTIFFRSYLCRWRDVSW